MLKSLTDKIFSIMILRFLVIFLSLCLFSCGQNNEKLQSYELRVKNGLFRPSEIKVPENTKFKLVVHNDGDRVEEFDSISLRREKIIPAKSKVVIVIAPLKKGVYEFLAEFSTNQGTGRIIVE